MNPTWEDPIPDEDDDENTYDKGFNHGRDAVIFLVDATWEMFQVNEEETPFQLSLKCARTTLTNKIISSSKDLIGIVLFGTEQTRNTRNNTDFQHIYMFQDLSEPGAEKVLETEELMSLDGLSFCEKYGHSVDFSLADALWVCGIMFSNCKFSLAHKRILLFTANDNPHEGNPQLQIQAQTKARDLHESDIDIDLMHIHKPNSSFDCSKFYKDIVMIPDDEVYQMPNAAERFDDLLTRVRCKDHRKRPLGKLQFTIGEGIKIAFKMYKLVVPTSKPATVKLAKETNQELITVSSTYLSDTGELLLPSDIKKYQEYAGKKIYVADYEAKQIRNFGEPGLLLMGFKPKLYLKPHYHLKPSLFLYPDEKSIQGSIRLCLALLIQCLKREYVPICRMIARQNDPPRFVALLPQEEHVDERGLQTIPPGFHVIYLPYTEDIRSIKIEKKHHPSEALVEKSKEIIKKLQFAYHPESFENPVLQKHWRNIEALALNRDAPEEIIDYTLPTKDVIEKRAGKLIAEFKLLLCPNVPDPSTSTYSPSVKRPRLDEDAVPLSLEHEATNGLLARYKANILKEFCKRNGIRCPSGAKKAEIMEAIKQYYHEQ
ncbi:X-ray repair cross-complementing protein 5-like isoform X2 [Stegodyphus dumicola]|nr:X-ray repair cross-complementing protein 5-like isoform X2 [Stegodyphus dumicola]XP_035204793.1 X-ray repair cross-complementing protein 5-like isoform X2 [Stegodyphus dumicola]